jgi:hypothetical protein
LVLWLRHEAKLHSPELGISVWAERAATEDRLKPIVDDLLNETALGFEILNASKEWTVESAGKKADKKDDSTSEPDEPPKIWEAAKAMAEALAEDDSKTRLVALWTDEILDDDFRRSVRTRLREHARRLAKADQSGNPSATGSIAISLATDYAAALKRAGARWAAATMPKGAVEGFLRDQDVRVSRPIPKAKPAPAKSRATKPPPNPPRVERAVDTQKTAAGEAATAPVTDFADAVQAVVARHFRESDVTVAVSKRIGRDLRFSSVQSGVAKAIHTDFSARWLWIISAALFFTGAVLTVFGGAERVSLLAETGRKIWPLVAFSVIVVAGIAAGLAREPGAPMFLAEPFKEFSDFYELDRTAAMRRMNLAAWVTIAALIGACWSAFLFKTRSVEHLETQLQTLRWSLHAATFVLVAGVVHLYALLQWPGSFLGEPAAEAVQAGAKTSAVALGAAFSTLLLLLYVPGAIVLTREAQGRSHGKHKDRIDKMLEDNGFDGSPTQQIGRFIQVFAPLLAAGLGSELFSFFSS